MSKEQPYNPKSTFDDRSLLEKPNSLSADKEGDLEKNAIPILNASPAKLRKDKPDLFTGDATQLMRRK